jgi:threonine/homoserine/homoserine lactone efflux protein
VNFALLAATVLPFVVSPGASFTITISATVTGDRWAPVKVWVGTSLGILVIAGVAGLSGLGHLISDSDVARTLFGLAGGLVLITLGVTTLIKTLRPERGSGELQRPGPWLIFWAFLTVIANVKALSLYVLVVPAMHGAGGTGAVLFLAFAAVHIVMLLAWLLLLGAAVTVIPGLGTSQRARTVLLLLAAAALIVLGGRTLFETAI